eukprot:1140356-Amphidinium_carterae.1
MSAFTYAVNECQHARTACRLQPLGPPKTRPATGQKAVSPTDQMDKMTKHYQYTLLQTNQQRQRYPALEYLLKQSARIATL